MPGINPKNYDTISPRKVAFLGLGVMGYPMAGHLAQAGHSVTVYNRTATKSEAWCAEFPGAQGQNGFKKTPREAVAGADFVFCCVGNDDDLRSVTLGADGAFAGMHAGTIFVDHTTASASVARELNAAAAALGLQFVDAPVSGGQAGAQNGMLTVMCGGDAAAFAAAQPVAQAFARAVTLLGDSGAGQLAKMVNQICIAGLVQGLSEAVAFGQRAGLDMVHVPFNGTPAAVQNLVGAQVSAAFLPLLAVLPHVQNGKVKVLAVSSPKRSPLMPTVATFNELGYPDMNIHIWSGISAPAGTPDAIIARLNTEIVKVLKQPEIQERWTAVDFEAMPSTPQEFTRYYQADSRRWAEAVRLSGFKANE